MTSTHAPRQATAADAPQISRARVWVTRGLALVLAVYALFSGWTLFYNVTPIAIATAGVLGTAAVGLWRMRPWSRWIVYALAAVVCLWFAWYLSRLIRGGGSYDDARSLIAMLPASLLLLCAIAAAAHVRSVLAPR